VLSTGFGAFNVVRHLDRSVDLTVGTIEFRSIIEPIRYAHRNLGMLAYVGGSRALADLESCKGSGWTAWLFWRSVYVTKIVSLRNKVRVLTDWVNARLFGRDTSRF
jgi:NADH dehydrogenase FAD-containing subunit